jgi:hypothetical protein
MKMSLPDEHSTSAPYKPRVALMGEFSAGKSTLANLLLEQACSPVQTTATQMPPIWYSEGADEICRVTTAGNRETMPHDALSFTPPADTQLIQVRMQAEILGSIDLIDMPGTSDPNLAVQHWDTMLPQVDIVVWCTPANQAWRQSEAALWEQAPDELRQCSLLLVTRMDKIRGDEDKARLLRRVMQEAGTAFGGVLPISLTTALAAPMDESVLERCGATAMLRFLSDALDKVGDMSRPEFKLRDPEPGHAPSPDTPQTAATTPGAVVPRRVVRKAGTSRPRARA